MVACVLSTDFSYQQLSYQAVHLFHASYVAIAFGVCYEQYQLYSDLN